MPEEHQVSQSAGAAPKEPALWFAFYRSELLVAQRGNLAELPCCPDLAQLGLNPLRTLYVGTYEGKPCYVSELPANQDLPAGYTLQGLRAVFDVIDEALAMYAGRAFQIMEWDRDHQFCSRCGTPTEVRENERARKCPTCRRAVYPPISPAIMVLITRGRELLLARRKGRAGRFSALAGFVEPGETLEETVRRETREEVGVEIENLRYFGSQPWPFPHSLMIAFVADYATGEIRPDGIEIEEARFFDAADLPQLPPGISISRKMINSVAEKLRKT